MGQDLHLPPPGDAIAAAVVLHPHPSMGGDRHHPLIVAIAERLAARGIAALRPDLTDPDPGAAAAALESAAAVLLAEADVDRLVLVGYSWGSVVSSLAAPLGLVARVLIAPPVSMLALAMPDEAPALVLVPAHDQYGGPAAVAETFGDRRVTTIEVLEGADHFMAGAVDAAATRTVEWAARLLSGSVRPGDG